MSLLAASAFAHAAVHQMAVNSKQHDVVVEPKSGTSVNMYLNNGPEKLKNFKVNALGVGWGWLSVYGCVGGWYKSENIKSNSLGFVMKMHRTLPSSVITNEEESFFGELFKGYTEEKLIREKMDKVFKMFPAELTYQHSLIFLYNEQGDKFELYYDDKLLYFVSECSKHEAHELHTFVYGHRNGATPNVCSIIIDYMKEHMIKYVK